MDKFLKGDKVKKRLLIKNGLTGEFVHKLIRDMSRLTISKYNLSLSQLPSALSGMKIIHLSDLHNKLYGKCDYHLYNAICMENPDLIVMTGDMLSHECSNRDDFLELIAALCRKYPLFYVNGNHELSDMSKQDFDYYSSRLAACGAVCLDNKNTIFEYNGVKIRIYGLCYPAKFYRGVRQYKFTGNKFKLSHMHHYCGKKYADDEFSILLAHNPLDFDVYAKWGADISFGGHIHGGFIRLPIVHGVLSPELKLFPKYKEGIYKKHNSALVVSRGLGRIRFFNPPELVCVILKQ